MTKPDRKPPSMALPPFCRSCGQVGVGLGSNCSTCGIDNHPASREVDQPMGLRALVSAGWVRRLEGVVGYRDGRGQYTVAIDGRWRKIPPGKRVELLDTEQAQREPSYMYRLLRAAAADQVNERLLRAYAAQVGEAISARRQLAVVASERGEWDVVQSAALTASEVTWLKMRRAFESDDQQAALEAALELPSSGYPDKAAVFAQQLGKLSSSPELRQRVLAQLRGLGDFAAALALRRMLGDSQASWPHIGPASSVIAAIEATDSGNELDLAALRSLPLSVLDDAIDAGVVRVDGLDEHLLDLPAKGVRYPRARLAPASLADDDALLALPFPAEGARRALCRGETVQEPVTAIEEPLLARYIHLSRLASGDTSAIPVLKELLDEEEMEIADAVRASVETDEVDPRAMSDSSAVAVLTRLLGEESIERKPGLTPAKAAMAALFEWDFDNAIAHSRECLRVADDEHLRDEALSMIAAAHLQCGRHDEALAALRHAIEGLDSPGLIVNFGIAAQASDPAAAAEELTRLAREAPSLELRVTAARRALGLYAEALPEEEDASEDVPAGLLSAFRSLAVASTDEETHRELLHFLCWADHEWLSDPSHTAASPHADTMLHGYFITRAADLGQGWDVLQEACTSSVPDWARYEIDEFADMLLARLLVDDTSAVAAAGASFDFLDRTLPLSDRHRFLLTVFATRRLIDYAFDQQAEGGYLVKSNFDRLVGVKPLITPLTNATAASADSEVDPPGPDYQSLFAEAVEAYAAACASGWFEEARAIEDLYAQIAGALNGRLRWQINWSAVREAAAPGKQAIRELRNYVATVHVHLPAGEIRTAVSELLQGLKELEQGLGELA